ncbi:MAG TPA: hypothetical protein VEG64_03205 [Candidatus Sulfotelmatobacter sp.]|nr:hypothetical protein [Candidatus Sulfotelmatobacter sp.]
MRSTKLILSGAALILLSVPAAYAQSAGSSNATAAAPDKPATIQQRKENQQDRIAQGVQSGQLTAGETKNLETKEADLNKEERNMRAADDGHLTAADRSKINQQQNRLSNQIYDDKHNGNVQHYAPGEIGQRQENQQDRIAQGIKSGQLTAGETAKLENQQQGINREISGMRQANGGTLTKADKAAVNQQQNKASRNIYNKKHNSAKQ